MKGVRIGISQGIPQVDITCDCGRNGLLNEATQQASFNHPVASASQGPQRIACRCGTRYEIVNQGGHFHIREAPVGAGSEAAQGKSEVQQT